MKKEVQMKNAIKKDNRKLKNKREGKVSRRMACSCIKLISLH